MTFYVVSVSLICLYVICSHHLLAHSYKELTKEFGTFRNITNIRVSTLERLEADRKIREVKASIKNQAH